MHTRSYTFAHTHIELRKTAKKTRAPRCTPTDLYAADGVQYVVRGSHAALQPACQQSSQRTKPYQLELEWVCVCTFNESTPSGYNGRSSITVITADVCFVCPLSS